MTEKHVIEYDVTEAAIAEMKAQYMGLVISDIHNTEEVKKVHDARMVVKGKRCEVERRRKELKADALAYGRTVDSKAREIFDKLEPIESHLSDEEDKVVQERKRIEAEKAEKERQRIQGMVDQFAKYGKNIAFHDVAKLTDDEFTATIAAVKANWEQEQKRLAEEKKAKEEEEKRLAAERAELEKIRKEQEAKEQAIREAQEKIDAENRRIEAEKKAEQERKEREEFERKAREEAKILAEKEAAAKAERERLEKIAKEKAEAEEKARKEALRPDKEKLLAWLDGLEFPRIELKSEEADTVYADARMAFKCVIDDIRKRAEAL